MRMTFGGQPVLDVTSERLNIARELTQHVPTGFERANSLMVPHGQAPARGWLCMLRGDLDELRKNDIHTLVIQDDENNTRRLGHLLFVRATCLTPDSQREKEAAYLVEIADRRWLCHNPHFCVPINKHYNVRAPAWGGQYYEDSLNGGAAWTWLTMMQNIANLMGGPLGGAPTTLPFTPDGTPEGFRFPGMSAWLALTKVLDRIGCFIHCNLEAALPYSISQIGTDDTITDAQISRLRYYKRVIYDGEPIEGTRMKVPYGVRVFFHKTWEHHGTEETVPQDTFQWSTNAVHTIDRTGPLTASETEPQIFHPLWDDLPALVAADGTTITNLTALGNRATERKDDFYRLLRDKGGGRLHLIFSGAWHFGGDNLKGVAWRQHGAEGGIVTEIVRHPFRNLYVDDQGKWQTLGFEDSSKLHAPQFRQTWPVHPQLLEVVRVVSGPNGSGDYDGFVELFDPTTKAWSDRDQIWIDDAND